MYTKDLVYRPGEDTSTFEVMPYYPDKDRGTYEVLPYLPNEQDKSKRPVAEDFLEAFLRSEPELLAGYVPFRGVAPADVDPGGPESPETLARFAEYLKMRRERGDFNRARDRLIQQGFPLGGV